MIKKGGYRMKKVLKSNLFISIVFFVMTICIFGPLELYVTNQSEIWFDLENMLIIISLISGVAIVALSGIGCLLRGKLRDLYSALLFNITLCMYIQGNFLNLNYGVLDGRTIVWSDYSTYAVINTAIWVIAMVGLLLLKKIKPEFFRRMAKAVSAFIIAVQVLTLGILVIGGNVLDEEGGGQLTVDHITEVGKKDNIIVFVLDTFEEPLMDSLMETDGEHYHQLFSDFTQFTDCAAGGATTAAAMPILINGKYYTDTQSYGDYLTASFNSDALYSTLKENKYTVDLYTDSAYVRPCVNGYVDNYIIGKGSPSSYWGLTAKYSEFTLFKYMPHILKQFFWLYSAELGQYQPDTNYTTDDAEFYHVISSNGLQVVGDNCFKLFHLAGGHYPYKINEFAQSDAASTRMQQVKGNLYIVEEYIRQMKACGVYDDALIIITSDHGDSEHYSAPILFVKGRGTNGIFTENDAPVSHIDLHPTLFSYLGMKKGDSFFDIPQTEQRDRLFYLRLHEGGIFYMQEYVISDKVAVVGCGTATGRKLGPTKEQKPIPLGTRMGLDADGQGLHYVVSGMDPWPLDSVETQGTECVFSFPMEEIQNKTLEITLDVKKLYRYDLEQSVQIYANGQLCHEQSITGNQRICFTVSPEVLTGKNLEVKLVLATKWCALYLSGVTIEYASDNDVKGNP